MIRNKGEEKKEGLLFFTIVNSDYLLSLLWETCRPTSLY